MARNKTSVRLSLCVLSVIILTGACRPALQTEPPRASQDLTPPPLLSVEALDARIRSLSRLLETQDLTREDRELAQDLLASYKGLKNAEQSGSLRQNHAAMIHILLKNLEKMEDRYFGTRRGKGGELSSEGLREIALKRKKILEAFSAGDDQAVIDGMLQLEKEVGPECLTPDLTVLLAMSLGKKGTFTTALNIGEEVSRQLEGKPDLIQLRAQMIDWQLALGNKKEAKAIYDRLKLKLTEREALVKSLEQRFALEPSKESSPDSPAPKEGALKAETDLELREALVKADEMVQKGDFGRAKFILLQQRIRFEDGPETERIDDALKSVETAEEKTREQGKTEVAAREPSIGDSQTELRLKEERQDRLRAAISLIRNDKYEEALLKLDELPASDPEVQELKNAAVEKIINRERNKAAKIFLAARNTKDPVKKEALLNSCYNVLKAVTEKYPSSPLIPKVQEHINQVTKELVKVKEGEG